MEELIKIQSELKAPKSQWNSFGKYNYRNQEDILEGLKPLLLKHGCTLSLSDNPIQLGDKIVVTAEATIINKEGKTVSVKASAGVEWNRKGMDVAQSFGASSSYARKYALGGLFLLDDAKQLDKPSPKAEKEEMSPKHSSWAKAIATVKAGTYSVASIEGKYKLSPETKKLLTDAVPTAKVQD